MGFVDDIVRYTDALKFAFMKPLKDGTTLKYAVLLIILTIAMLVGVIAAFLLPIMGLLSSGAGILALLNPAKLMAAIMAGLGLAFVVMIVGGLATAYISALIIIRALQLAGYNPPRFGFIKYVRFIIVNIAAFFFVLLSIYRLKWLLLPVTAIVLFIIGGLFAFMNPLMGILAFGVGMILILAYFVVASYNSIRLSFPHIVLLNSSAGILECLKTSDTMTNGRFWSIFGMTFVFGLIYGAAQGVMDNIIRFVVGLMVTPDTVLAAMGGANIASILAPILAVLGILFIIYFVVIVILGVMGTFLEVGLFQLVLRDYRGAAAPGAPAPRMPSGKAPSERVIESAAKGPPTKIA